ncbi:nickel pincer cofactor biosynthesis protein LarC [Methanoculleus sp. FWC-SCC1]|uniref:Nickel pincer cofactor biosynthesis protein LarC n=1 Tax=Methanoculleus frigidifontis TaxID=2584085 RepID=A0ABT8MAC9_9EURY|nr:nickel pincer cofactor biosynthesis protein LarC [Methanoculleus sp. FWC-SCC1]MDN7024887.1 nickel pincer cofactor biosynthesis protein LarC [Methanoculleus sp. FWC-SCC1]
MKALVIDPKIAGIAGDMLLSSLIDLTDSADLLDPLAGAIAGLGHCRDFSFIAEEVDAGGITAVRLDIRIEEERSGNGDDLRQSLLEVADAAGLPERARSRGLAVLDDLIAAEAKLHRTGFHLHEIASVDTIFDILGSLLILEDHGFLDGVIYATPPALGGGVIRMAHGEIAAPAPATLEVLCRHRLPYTSLPAETELTTPTGAAMLAAIAEKVVDPYPAMTPVRVGYGAGTRGTPGKPNVLRVVEGEAAPVPRRRVVMLETNLDDISGELIGYTIERMMAEGAIDVFVTQAIGKKNRPVSIISVMVHEPDVNRMIAALMDETGTLGVRICNVPKVVAHRSKERIPVTIGGRTFPVQIKTSTLDGRVVARKPEYDDLAAIARELHLPLRAVDEAVRRCLPGGG